MDYEKVLLQFPGLEKLSDSGIVSILSGELNPFKNDRGYIEYYLIIRSIPWGALDTREWLLFVDLLLRTEIYNRDAIYKVNHLLDAIHQYDPVHYEKFALCQFFIDQLLKRNMTLLSPLSVFPQELLLYSLDTISFGKVYSFLLFADAISSFFNMDEVNLLKNLYENPSLTLDQIIKNEIGQLVKEGQLSKLMEAIQQKHIEDYDFLKTINPQMYDSFFKFIPLLMSEIASINNIQNEEEKALELLKQDLALKIHKIPETLTQREEERRKPKVEVLSKKQELELKALNAPYYKKEDELNKEYYREIERFGKQRSAQSMALSTPMRIKLKGRLDDAYQDQIRGVRERHQRAIEQLHRIWDEKREILEHKFQQEMDDLYQYKPTPYEILTLEKEYEAAAKEEEERIKEKTKNELRRLGFSI